MLEAHWSRRFVVAGMLVFSLAACTHREATPPAAPLVTEAEPSVSAYHVNILRVAAENTAYRRVLFTRARMQLVVMSIPPGGDVGEEMHQRVEQILFCAEGSGRAIVNGVPSPFKQGDVVFVPAGTRHNIVNDGGAALKIYTIYAPPNHIPGRVQQTKAAAEADKADEAYGRRVE